MRVHNMNQATPTRIYTRNNVTYYKLACWCLKSDQLWSKYCFKMLCDQQQQQQLPAPSSFSVRDILDFGASGSDIDVVLPSELLMLPAVNQQQQEFTHHPPPPHYYTNYWLDNNPPIIAPNDDVSIIQQPGQIDPLAASNNQQHYNDYYCSYGPSFDQEFHPHHQQQLAPDQDEEKTPKRPLTTSHHVQQLSHLCPPFLDEITAPVVQQQTALSNSLKSSSNKNSSHQRKFSIQLKEFQLR